MAEDLLNERFAALADPTRRAILMRLSRGVMSVNELAQPFAMSLPAISRHLKVLERSGLISRSKTAQQRPARFEPKAMRAVAEWVDQYRVFWDASFDRLDEYLKDINGGDGNGD
ncbi:ArsR/SmtB family transcription factor [Sphingomonas profundi]|uniref:ArsR/SmtB family transcription factor n=1 Tax=Alterirhizorhabdus profundi TaxID=2681549 RepID=UPI0012E98CB2|nr:metalloregulator ArsR/SmtB family transcription factor [Sphingomonas profundi]